MSLVQHACTRLQRAACRRRMLCCKSFVLLVLPGFVEVMGGAHAFTEVQQQKRPHGRPASEAAPENTGVVGL